MKQRPLVEDGHVHASTFDVRSGVSDCLDEVPGLGGGGGLVSGIAHVCLTPSQPTISTVANCKHRSQPGVSVKCHKWGNNFTKLCSWTCGHSSWTTLAKKCPLRIHTSLLPHIGCYFYCPTATRTNIKLCWSWTNAKGLCQRLNFSRVSECVPTINRQVAVEKWIVMTNVKASRTTALAGTAQPGLGLDGRQSVRRTAAAALQGRAVTWWDVSRVVFYPATFLTQLNFLACLWLGGGTSFSPNASNRIEMWGCCSTSHSRYRRSERGGVMSVRNCFIFYRRRPKTTTAGTSDDIKEMFYH